MPISLPSLGSDFQVLINQYPLTTQWSRILSANPQRWAAIISNPHSVNMRIALAGDYQTGSGINIPVNTLPITMYFSTHATLVTSEWWAKFTANPPLIVSVYEVIYQPSQGQIVPYGKPTS